MISENDFIALNIALSTNCFSLLWNHGLGFGFL